MNPTRYSVLALAGLLMLLCACGVPAPGTAPPASAPTHAAEVAESGDTTSGPTAAEPTAPDLPETESAAPPPASAAVREFFPTAPADFDPRTADSVRDYFLVLLRTGGEGMYGSDEPVLSEDAAVQGARALCRIYENSVFAGIPVGAEPAESWGALSGMAFADGSQPDYEGRRYLLRLDIPEGTAGPLRPGGQEWVLDIDLQYAGSLLLPARFVPREKFEAVQHTNEDAELIGKVAHFRSVCELALGLGSFDSPSAVPPEIRTAYLLTNAPPDGITRDGGPCLSQGEMDRWSQLLWGSSPYADPGSRFYGPYGPEGELVYTLWIGWGPSPAEGEYVGRWEENGATRLWLEHYAPDDTLKTVPVAVTEYTVRDGLVWSGADATSVAGLSPYPGREVAP